ncbi:MAG TPA: TldD/PmbA family protein [Chloroflexota bacterium]|jgi:TldD protein|nr:TldD/PmbA family protein [Chloroflexota bacterium]
MGQTEVGYFKERYGVDEPLVASLLGEALSRGGDYAELFFEHQLSRSINFEEQAVKGTSSGVTQGVGVRVVCGEAIGYAYTEAFEPEAMRRAARTAANIAAGTGSSTPAAVAPRQVPHYYDLDHYSVHDPAASKVALLRRADGAARAYAPSVARVQVSYSEQLRHVAIASSEGALVEDVQPQVSLRVQVISERDGDRQSGYAGRAGRVNLSFLEEVTPEVVAVEAARLAVQLHDAREAPAGTLPVVLGPGEAGVLIHEAVGHGLEADFNRKRTSAYTDRIGERVAPPAVTVVDDGTIPHHLGSVNVDDEGTPGQRTVLIEHGVLTGYLQDWISARHFGVASTGNGRRESFRTYPQPRMRNTFLLGGQDDPQAIIGAVQRGIYCARFGGGSVNISNGDFVFNTTEAYLIEGGKITAPIRPTNLTGNGPDLLTKVTMVGHDLQQSRGTWQCGKNGQGAPVGVGLPTVLVSEVVVGGTGR